MTVRLLPAFLLALIPAASFADEAEFVPLFDGKTLEGWTTSSGKPVPQGWAVEDGAIHRTGRAGEIISTQKFEDFELHFQWKIASGGNSGVKYRLVPVGTRFFGCEYQLLDDLKHPNAKNPATSAGALYQLKAPNESKKLKPVGEWNTSKIVVDGTHLEHWLNDKKILELDVDSDEWKGVIAKSKYRSVKGFGEPGPTSILLQDHGNEVWFRDIKVRPLNRKIGANR